MAAFCRDCAEGMFGNEEYTELNDIVTEEQVEQGNLASALCEGCGPVLVDHTGKVIELIWT